MKESSFIAVVSVFGCGLALPAPCHEPLIPSSSCVTPNTPHSFFSSIYSSEFSYSYYNYDTCVSVGYEHIPDYIPTILYEDIERMMLEAKCGWLNSFSTHYPPNIAPNLWDLPDEVVTYDFLIVYSGPGVLNTLEVLIGQGFSVAIVEEGSFPPAIANSVYYRNAILNSPFVKPYEAHIPGCDVPKTVYVANGLGGSSIFDSNSWDYGCRSLYDNLSQFDSRFSWDEAYSRYQKFEKYEETSTVTTETRTVEVSSCGSVSITTSVKETSTTKRISSVFSEMGFGDDVSPLDIDNVPGLHVVPSIGAGGESSLLYPQQIFGRLASFDLVDLVMGLRIERLMWENGRVIGVQVRTAYGPKIIYCRYDVLLGGSPVSTFQLMTRSGFGNSLHLNKFGIPVLAELPCLGHNLVSNPIFLNPFIRFPRGVLVDEFVNDFSALGFLFGGNSLSSLSSLNYYSAFVNVRGSQVGNVMIRFYAFGKSMSYYIQYTLAYYFKLDYKMVQYILDVCENYDVLFMAPQLLTPLSTGYIDYGETVEDVRINLGMYQNQEDAYAMIEAIQYVEQISQTSAISSMGGELLTLPFDKIPLSGSFFSSDYLSQVLPYFTVPNLHLAGGCIMGSSYENSAVDTSFYFHNIPNVMCVSPSISPFPLQADSNAFGSLLGRYATEFILDRFASGFYNTLSSSNGYSTNAGSIISKNGLGLDTYSSASSSFSSSKYDTNARDLTVGGLSNAADSEAEAASYSSDTIFTSLGGLTTSQNHDSSYASTESEYASTTVLGGGGGMVSEYEASEAEASSSSYSSTWMGCNGMSSISQSLSESNSSCENGSTQIIGGCGC